jgi:ACS family hexuronate transporter-like MFS transporter
MLIMDDSQRNDATGELTTPGGETRSGIAAQPNDSVKIGHFRWVICALLLFGTTKNYMDRQILGLLKVPLQHTFNWNEIDYDKLVSAFLLAYGLGQLFVGRLMDRLGTRIGYALAMVCWSVASMGTAMANSLNTFALSRYALGFGEAAVFPASLKAVAEWFPKKERALATGIFNAGTNLGAMITPLLVPWIVSRWGWQAAFVLIGAVGLLWLAVWLPIYRPPAEHPRISKNELAYISSDPAEPLAKISWLRLIPLRQKWAYIFGKLLIDPVWWFYLFWVPGFLQTKHGLALTQIGLPIVTIYLLSDAGSVAGGWISSSLIKRGRSVNAARKTAMLLCAVAVVPVFFTYRVQSTWGAVLLIGFAAACHQGFSANLFTLPSDMFPGTAVGTVVGIGGAAGALAGMYNASVVGHVLQWTGSYMVPFAMASSSYLVALALIHILAPRLAPARIAGA